MKLIKLSLFTALFIFLQLPLVAHAQPKAKGEPKVIIEGDGNIFQNPIWSPDGSSFAYTSVQFQGIWIADKNGNNARQITDKSAGYGMSWSSDSETILTRVTDYSNRRKQTSINLFNSSTAEETLLSEPRPNIDVLPQWAQFDEKVVLISDNGIESFTTGKKVDEDKKKLLPNQSFYLLKKNQLAKGKIPENSTEDISPFDDVDYLNLQVSPDGTKLAFEVYGGNLYVMNVDGTGLIDLGAAYRPSWSPDSRYIVANKTEDDGHDITSADILAFDVSGNEVINLTENTPLIAMNPSWAPDDSGILFNDPQTGSIYLLEITR